MAIASVADTVKRTIAFRAALRASPMAGVELKILRFVDKALFKWAGNIGGMLYAVCDIYEGIQALNDDKPDIGLSYLVSGGSVLWLTAIGNATWIITTFGLGDIALAVTLLGPWGIVAGVVLLLGSTAWIMYAENEEKRNDIQTWILASLWGKAPAGEKNLPEPFPNSETEKEAFTEIIKENNENA